MPIGFSLLLLFLAFYLWSVLTPTTMDKAVTKGKQQGNAEPVIKELQKKPIAYQGRFFEQTMTKIWNQGDREFGLLVLQRFIHYRPSDPSGHKWVQQVLESEPTLRANFEDGFLDEFFNPNLIPGGAGG